MRTIPSVLAPSVCVALAAFACAGSALAQDAPAPAPPAPATGDAKLPPIAADAKPQTPPPAGQNAGNDDKDDADDDTAKDDGKDDGDDEDAPKKHRRKKKDEGDRARFRGGVSAFGGAYVFGGYGIPFGGVEGRLGVQIKDWVAVYAEPAVLLGFQIGQKSAGAIARVSLGVIPEFTVADLWFIGAGPEAYAVIGGSADSNGGVVFGGGSVIGVDFRTGFAFGSKRPGRRKCFTIAFDGRLDFFHDRALTAQTNGTTTQLGGGVGFAPALSLGYDAM